MNADFLLLCGEARGIFPPQGCDCTRLFVSSSFGTAKYIRIRVGCALSEGLGRIGHFPMVKPAGVIRSSCLVLF